MVTPRWLHVLGSAVRSWPGARGRLAPAPGNRLPRRGEVRRGHRVIVAARCVLMFLLEHAYDPSGIRLPNGTRVRYFIFDFVTDGVIGAKVANAVFPGRLPRAGPLPHREQAAPTGGSPAEAEDLVTGRLACHHGAVL